MSDSGRDPFEKVKEIGDTATKSSASGVCSEGQGDGSFALGVGRNPEKKVPSCPPAKTFGVDPSGATIVERGAVWGVEVSVPPQLRSTPGMGGWLPVTRGKSP